MSAVDRRGRAQLRPVLMDGLMEEKNEVKEKMRGKIKVSFSEHFLKLRRCNPSQSVYLGLVPRRGNYSTVDRRWGSRRPLLQFPSPSYA